MTDSKSSFENFYPVTQIFSVPTEHTILNFLPSGSSDTQLFPIAEVIDDPRPNHRKRILNNAIDKLKQSKFSGSDYAIAHLHDKYQRHLTVHTLRQTGQTLLAFLTFFHALKKQGFTDITKHDIAAYIEHEQDRDLNIISVKHHLATVYAFIQFLVDNQVLPPEILLKKIRIKLPEVLPRAIPAEDLQRFLAVIKDKRDRALILLLLHTGMRIGELIRVKMSDIILPERKILLHLGEKNYQGRVVYYSAEAEKALQAWLNIRKPDQEYLFYGRSKKLFCYGHAWMIMREYLKTVGMEHKGYSLHSLRHTFATNLLNAGLRLEVLQQLLGHRSIDVTLRYARISNTTRENEYFKAMAVIEKGENHEDHRVSSHLQEVFEEKKLLRSHR